MDTRPAALPLLASALVTLALVGPHALQAGGATPSLLDALTGDWRGRAYSTPVGPRPYDLNLRRTDEGVSGVAHPGAAEHHWTFYADQDGLHLRFLTTFRGNTEPTWLDAVATRDGTTRFRARMPAWLTVEVTPSDDGVHIEVLHRGEHHVGIRLWSRDDGGGRGRPGQPVPAGTAHATVPSR